MENVSINCSSHVYGGSDVKGKCLGVKHLGISLAIVNVLSIVFWASACLIMRFSVMRT